MKSAEFPAPLRLGVLASGRGSNLQALLTAQEEGRLYARVTLVLSDRQDAQALERARRHGVEALFLDPATVKARLPQETETAYVEALRAHGAEWVVLAGFFRIIGSPLLDAFPGRILNIHPSLLPSFPGLHGQRQALEYGVKIAGCTVHLVTSGVDQGPILMQSTVEVQEEDTEETLADRILAEEHRILVESVNRIATAGFRLEGRRVRWNNRRSGS
jgi:phosphoribosylglycinamide formyltransferase 1